MVTTEDSCFVLNGAPDPPIEVDRPVLDIENFQQMVLFIMNLEVNLLYLNSLVFLLRVHDYLHPVCFAAPQLAIHISC